MIVSGMQKLTLLDYEGKLACMLFTPGCNFKCPFCQNSGLIIDCDYPVIPEKEIFEYLSARKNILDGVVISGGEPTLQKELKIFIKKIKDLGLLVKLDTNGYNWKVVKELIDENLIDYIAMDIKNDLDNYDIISGLKKIDTSRIKTSIEIIKNSNISHEFRTTIIKGVHTINNIEKIISLVGSSKYFIQNFKMSEMVIDKSLESFSREELINMKNNLCNKYKNVFFRDL